MFPNGPDTGVPGSQLARPSSHHHLMSPIAPRVDVAASLGSHTRALSSSTRSSDDVAIAADGSVAVPTSNGAPVLVRVRGTNASCAMQQLRKACTLIWVPVLSVPGAHVAARGCCTTQVRACGGWLQPWGWCYATSGVCGERWGGGCSYLVTPSGVVDVQVQWWKGVMERFYPPRGQA